MNNNYILSENDKSVLRTAFNQLIKLEGVAATYFNACLIKNNIAIRCTCITENENPIEQNFLVNYLAIMEYLKKNLETKFMYTVTSLEHFIELTQENDKNTENNINKAILIYSKNNEFNRISQDIKLKKTK